MNDLSRSSFFDLSIYLGHIMGGCPWVLNVENKTSPNEDRYTWRHNNVLRVLCNAIIHKVQQCNADNHKNNISGIQFVKEEASATTINTAKTQNKRKGKLSMEILQELMIGQFSSNFQN